MPRRVAKSIRHAGKVRCSWAGRLPVLQIGNDLIDPPLTPVKIRFMAAEVKTFREVCCDRLGIPPAAFEKKVLLACLPSYYWLLGLLRWHLNRSYFKRDLEIVRAAAECTSVRDIRAEITYFHHQKTTGFQRNVLHFRISGKRLLSFANKFLPQN
jgi:hypothetical protein